jgi:hypothetical protein
MTSPHTRQEMCAHLNTRIICNDCGYGGSSAEPAVPPVPAEPPDDPCTAKLKAEWHAAHPDVVKVTGVPAEPRSAEQLEDVPIYGEHVRMSFKAFGKMLENEKTLREQLAAATGSIHVLEAALLSAQKEIADLRQSLKKSEHTIELMGR